MKTHALRLSRTKNLHFAAATFPRFSAIEVRWRPTTPVSFLVGRQVSPIDAVYDNNSAIRQVGEDSIDILNTGIFNEGIEEDDLIKPVDGGYFEIGRIVMDAIREHSIVKAKGVTKKVEFEYTQSAGNRDEQLELMNAEYLAKNAGLTIDSEGQPHKSISENDLDNLATNKEAMPAPETFVYAYALNFDCSIDITSQQDNMSFKGVFDSPHKAILSAMATIEDRFNASTPVNFLIGRRINPIDAIYDNDSAIENFGSDVVCLVNDHLITEGVSDWNVIEATDESCLAIGRAIMLGIKKKTVASTKGISDG